MIEDIRKLESERLNIIVSLDKACSIFHELAFKAMVVGLHINGKLEVCGDPQMKAANSDLIQKIEKKGEETVWLTDELTKVDCKLDKLYNETYQDLINRYATSSEHMANIAFINKRFQKSLSNRTAGDFLEKMTMFLDGKI